MSADFHGGVTRRAWEKARERFEPRTNGRVGTTSVGTTNKPVNEEEVPEDIVDSLAELHTAVKTSISSHQSAQIFCEVYSTFTDWGSTLLSAVTTALSAVNSSGSSSSSTTSASTSKSNPLSLTLLAIATMTTVLNFWSSYSKFGQQVLKHKQAQVM